MDISEQNSSKYIYIGKMDISEQNFCLALMVAIIYTYKILFSYLCDVYPAQRSSSVTGLTAKERGGKEIPILSSSLSWYIIDQAATNHQRPAQRVPSGARGSRERAGREPGEWGEKCEASVLLEN